MNAHAPEARYRVGRSRAGLGLFATALIGKGEFIVDYTGPRVANAEVERMRSGRYLFEINSRWTIDGSPRTNMARYVNHSCRPNAEPMIAKGRIRIKATKRIQPGEEITYDYGRAYFKEYIQPVGCKCAACKPNWRQAKAR